MNIKNLTEAVNKIWRNFRHHEGRGGDTHPVVNNFNAGFMSPDLLKLLKASNGAPTELVLTGTPQDLAAGMYPNYANDIIGMPSKDGFYLIDVSTYQKYKNITAYRPALNEIYFKSIDSQNKPGNGIDMWGKITKEYELYRYGYGRDLSTGGVIELAEDVTKFDEIIIHYFNNVNDYSVLVAPGGLKNGRSLNALNVYNAKDGFQIYECDISIDESKPRQLRIGEHRAINVSKNGTIWDASNSTEPLKIYKIVGRR